MKTIIRCILGSLFFASPASIADPDSVPTMQEVCEFRITLKELASLSKQEPEGHTLNDPSSCVLTELEIVDEDNRTLLRTTDRYFERIPVALRAFPFVLIRTNGGGTGGHITYLLIREDGVSVRIPNSGASISIRKSASGFELQTLNHQITLPR